MSSSVDDSTWVTVDADAGQDVESPQTELGPEPHSGAAKAPRPIDEASPIPAAPEPSPAERARPAPQAARQQQRQEQQQRQQAPAASILGGWGSLSARFKEAAAGITQDFEELSGSLHKALAEGIAPEPQAPPAKTPEANPRVRAALDRLQQDDSLEVGLKAIDDQVEQLATGVSRSFGSLWQGASGMLRSGITYGQRVAEQVEEAASLAAGHLQDGVRVGGVLAAHAEQGLERFSQRAADLLDEGFGEARQGDGSFEASFRAVGGQQSFEELESLVNDCARLCNRLRARMAPQEQARMDAMLTSIAPIFDLQKNDGGEADALDKAAQSDASESPIGHGHAAIAEALQQGLDAAAAIMRDSESAPAPGSAAGEHGAGPQVDEDTLAALLERLREAGGRCMGELCLLCVERLLSLGRSVSAQFRNRESISDDRIAWPGPPAAKAEMLRTQAERMLEDLARLAAAYMAALERLAKNLEGRPAMEDAGAAVGELVEALRAALRADETAARHCLQQALQGLLFMVLLTTCSWQQ